VKSTDLSLQSYLVAEDGKTNLPIRELFLLLDSLIKEIHVELRQQGREDEFTGFKVTMNRDYS